MGLFCDNEFECGGFYILGVPILGKCCIMLLLSITIKRNRKNECKYGI